MRERILPTKIDQDSTPGVKLLRLFRKLMLNGRRHFQSDLAKELQCSPQTIIRLMGDIESVIGINLESGTENRRRWYRMKPLSRNGLGLEFEELRYLAICRDLAVPILPREVRRRVDDTIFNLSLLMADHAYAAHEQRERFSFFAKGKIDYTPHFQQIETLLQSAEEKRICLVQYKAAGKQSISEHRLAVNRLVSMNNALYVLGAVTTDDFKDMRRLINLAVHRIKAVTLTDKHFCFDMPEAEPGNFGLPWHEPRTFRIRFTPGKASDYVRERIWADRQQLEELDDGGVMLEITTRSEPELMAWVRSFGEDACLIGRE